MNRDADAARAFLMWLLQNPTSDQPLEPSGNPTSDNTSFNKRTGVPTSEVTNSIDQTVNPIHRHNAEDQDTMLTNFSQLNLSSSGQPPGGDALSFELGEMSAVQDRFYAVLKRRLRAEIEQNPPLFPWENEILEYEEEGVSTSVGTFTYWLRQIQERLPVPMSEQALVTLFNQCQTVVHQSLQHGTKLVQSVEALFPGEEEMLNYLARLVLAPSFRDGGVRLPTDGFPSHYDVATPVQQMALSLITAVEILDALTIKVSSQNPQVHWQWPMATDTVDVTVSCQFHPTPRLRVESRVPSTSQLRLSGPAGEARSHRDKAGHISVELFDICPNQTYQLTFQLPDETPVPLSLAIQVGE